MKIVYVVLGVALLIFVTVQLFAMKSQKDIETYPYKLVKKYDQFEIRNYEETLFASVKLTTSEYKASSSKGFSILAGYIFGGNETNEKIAMTSPVAMSLEDSMTMMFMVPKKFDKESLPKPNQSEIVFTKVPAKTVAAITFSGWANDKKIARHKAQLISALEVEGIEYTNRYYFLGYNPPFELFNRRNEVIVELK
tara:strand:- start:797 stop:1381 length:585 start_codon:yes stop_codon:yes gene_type:complete